jgi:hypothetical protein
MVPKLPFDSCSGDFFFFLADLVAHFFPETKQVAIVHLAKIEYICIQRVYLTDL